MTLLIDPPSWPAHGRLWSHLVSDSSYEELHEFAARHGLPARAFDRDHYDVPGQAHDSLVRAGAQAVSSRELLARLMASGLRRRRAESPGRRGPGQPLIRPARLRAGDLVAVVAPAGPAPSERVEAGVSRLESWGLRVRVGAHAFDGHPSLRYLAATDAARAADFETAWLDGEVRAVMCTRGGYGVQRMLDLVDWTSLAEAEPKLLIGYSDITALHQAAASRLGLVSVLGHVATSLGSATQASAEGLRRLLFEPEAIDILADQEVETVVAGSARGALVGGNLAILATGVGSRLVHSARGGIVVLEDVTEELYRLDRYVTQLLRSGWFDGVAGLVLGQFTRCGNPADVQATLRDLLVPLGVPMVAGADIGHTSSSLPVPLGVPAELAAATDGTAHLTLLTAPLA